jgi:hypothetical protein
MDRGRTWIVAGDGKRPEMDRSRTWFTKDGSHLEEDCGRIWMATCHGWITEDGSQEMDHGRRMTINLLPYKKLLR